MFKPLYSRRISDEIGAEVRLWRDLFASRRRGSFQAAICSNVSTRRKPNHRRPKTLRPQSMDNLSKQERSNIMARVRSKDTKPELFLRSLVFALGYRYRLHSRRLPGCPDLVFTSRRSVIFVHGCFWHRHSKCALARMPKSRKEFWESKLTANRLRDRRNVRLLAKEGWRVLTVWECELGDPDELRERVRRFLDA
jgi:DNA mismatch endonuclease, patch repair protein